ncbi:lipopolysaccharide export system protein LptA [Idiomarina fontislapidosi]|uniref:Lipopolysaccharide export system protein LptA n=1 Tax=Idiomarina fontislapidosi TaxID=263723 RepID=A0A432Y2I7_9GAMM|nr:lipopolysaccharide transport periplasmic protein LptA [Idiomarina fontislapidosi]PYE33320.1 lipopolysaccharide export system protein LptA [Idiomarina fontislapidosi]RUO55155.1 lipopolysaccharide transport periplasmic protein LptA [Idiomarina fontislapidosi]
MLKRFLILASLTAMSQVAMAQGEADFKKPIEVNAGHEHFDIKNNQLLLTDNVIVTQGSLRIEADRLEASGGEAKDQADIFIAHGRPAIYTQLLDDGSEISAQADQITYFQSQGRIELKGNAQITQGSSLSRGDTIVYDLANQHVSARGSEESGERVTTIFNPNKQPEQEQPEDNQQQQEQ